MVARLGTFIAIQLIGVAAAMPVAMAAGFVERWTSVRALGMGNAYTAIVDDSDSLFYNPAGLARRGGFHWQIADPRVGVNGLDAYQAYQAFSESDDMAQLFDDLYGKSIWLGGGGKTLFQLGGLAAAGFAHTDASMLLQNPAYPVFDVEYAMDYGFAVGAGFDLIPYIMKVGVAARRITRTGTAAPIGASTLATLEGSELERQLKNRGTGYGLDLGVVLTIPSPVRPSLSFVWKDIGNTAFIKESGDKAPKSIASEMIVGAALEFDTPIITISPTVDFKHLNVADEPIGKKIHLGVEVDLPLVDLRAGMHQGYYTLGAGLGLGLLQLDVATWGVELGAYPGQLEDRRYMVQLSLELGLDPGGLFGGFGSSKSGSGSGASGSGGGGRRRLKQRR